MVPLCPSVGRQKLHVCDGLSLFVLFTPPPPTHLAPQLCFSNSTQNLPRLPDPVL